MTDYDAYPRNHLTSGRAVSYLHGYTLSSIRTGGLSMAVLLPIPIFRGALSRPSVFVPVHSPVGLRHDDEPFLQIGRRVAAGFLYLIKYMLHGCGTLYRSCKNSVAHWRHIYCGIKTATHVCGILSTAVKTVPHACGTLSTVVKIVSHVCGILSIVEKNVSHICDIPSIVVKTVPHKCGTLSTAVKIIPYRCGILFTVKNIASARLRHIFHNKKNHRCMDATYFCTTKGAAPQACGGLPIYSINHFVIT